MDVAVMVVVPAVAAAVYSPVDRLMVPVPVSVQVTPVHSGSPEFGLAELHVAVTALKGTPVTLSENDSVSPVPIENDDGLTVTVTPEVSVTVADAVMVVFGTVATTVMVVFGGIAAGAVYKPVVSIVPTVEFPPPTPLTVHVTLLVEPVTAAVNCVPLFSITVAVVGEMVTETPVFALWQPVVAALTASTNIIHCVHRLMRLPPNSPIPRRRPSLVRNWALRKFGSPQTGTWLPAQKN